MTSSETDRPERYVVVAFGISSIGGRENNEDSYLITNLKSQDESGGTHDGLDRGVLLVVSDGMGGSQAGEVASSAAVETLRATLTTEWVQQERSMLAELENDINAAFIAANNVVKEKAAANSNMEGMGATLTAAVLLQNRLALGHVGDSRCYISRGDQLKQVSTDHTLVEDLISQGKLTREQAEIHPQRSLLSHAIGLEDELKPQLRSFSLRTGDRVLLCSDGLTDHVDEESICEVLSESIDPEFAAHELLERALTAAQAASVEADNITIIVGRLRRIEARIDTKPSFDEKRTRERVRIPRDKRPTPVPADKPVAGADEQEPAAAEASTPKPATPSAELGSRALEREAPAPTAVAGTTEGPRSDAAPSGATTAPVIETRAADGARQLDFVRLPDALSGLPDAITRGFEQLRATQRVTERVLFVVCGVLFALLLLVAILMFKLS